MLVQASGIDGLAVAGRSRSWCCLTMDSLWKSQTHLDNSTASCGAHSSSMIRLLQRQLPPILLVSPIKQGESPLEPLAQMHAIEYIEGEDVGITYSSRKEEGSNARKFAECR